MIISIVSIILGLSVICCLFGDQENQMIVRLIGIILIVVSSLVIGMKLGIVLYFENIPHRNI